jgi:hypothetical protein
VCYPLLFALLVDVAAGWFGSSWFVAVVISSPEVGSVFGLSWFASVLPPHV